MRAHTRKLHTNQVSTRSRPEEEDKPIHWLEAFKESFGDVSHAAIALRGFRNREKLTQESLGKLLDIPQTSISKMESGKRPIGKRIAKKLADFFKTDYRIFL